MDWLISVSDKEGTRSDYLVWLSRFLKWTGWRPGDLFSFKREALRQGEPQCEVEAQMKRFHESLRKMGYAGLTRAQAMAALYSFLGSKGYTVKRKLIRLDMSCKLEMRVPSQEEVQLFLEYAKGIKKKLLYTLMTETPCRPRVFAALKWGWLEPEWWTKTVAHVALPREFQPSNQGGPRKFEPVSFIGPKSISLLKQYRESQIRVGKVPLEMAPILSLTYDAIRATVQRDYEDLTALGLLRPSRRAQDGELVEQPVNPKGWRKYGFNVIDACVDISPEWRKMLKGRDLNTEKYYSQENVEALREIYRERIQPKLWSDANAAQNQEEVRTLRTEVEGLRQALRDLEDRFIKQPKAG